MSYPFDTPGYTNVLDDTRLWGRSCVQCTDPAPACSCAKGESCVQIERTCSECVTVKCISSSSSKGINPGIIAGPIIGVALIAASLVLFWWLRRKKQRDLARLEDLAERARKGESSAFHLSTPASPSAAARHRSQQSGTPRSPASGGSGGMRQAQRQVLPNVPADAEFYDENGATIRVYSASRGVINADPNHPDNGGTGDPFADQRSMSTSGSGHSTNVIPIHFVPAGQSDDLANGEQPSVDQQAQAARTLDLARQNLFRPGARPGVAPPPRPARAPDLDLRLNPPRAGNMAEANSGSSRISIASMTSGAPSFLSSNTADLHLDVPKIVTRQQVHVGRLQAAEVVQFSTLRAAQESADNRGAAANPFNEKEEVQSAAASQETFGSEVHSGGEAAQSRVSVGSRRFDDDGNAVSQPSPTDLRFSMGSLAYDRTSVSTNGTRQMPPPPPPPYTAAERPRFESMSSAHSVGGDSLLGSFPMIAPHAGGQSQPHPLSGGIPQNLSTTSLDLANSARPPTAFRGAQARPLTATSSHSVADSFLGSFPFVPPNVNGDGSPVPPMPGARGSQQANPGRLTLGMSAVSEGLGDFDFSFESSGHPASAAAAAAAAGQGHGGEEHEEHVEDPTTPRAPTMRR